jgi:hypothetical protein
MNSIDLYRFASEIAASISSTYTDSREHRRKLREYLTDNNWFGLERAAKGNAGFPVPEEDAERIRPFLTLWLSALEQPHGVKTTLLLNHFKAEFPVFCQLFADFIKGKNIENTFSYWHLLDYLFSEMTKDILDYSEEEVEALAVQMGDELPLNAAKVFSDFLAWMPQSGNGITAWKYNFHRREQPGVDHTAYTMRQFAALAYFVFNESAWAEQGLIQKAAGNRLYADLWVFAAFNVICALRVGDLKRLPAPSLPIARGEIHNLAVEGALPAAVALAVTSDLESRVKLLGLKPSKTASRSNVPSLKLFVPESLREPLGLIIAIALSHRPEVAPGDSFIVPSTNHKFTESFFGNGLTSEISRLVPRRCNKAYLQGIDAIGGADNAPGKPKGYMLAALARSHKGGLGTLGQTTEIYLRDAKFAGYTPEFIAKEMFERGVFSFIPSILLEMYGGEQYRQLPIRAQTSLITQLGLSAQNVERIAVATERALACSRETVRSVFGGTAGTPTGIFNALQNIASGNAPSRQEEWMCLMTATGYACPYPERACCLGCGYEIYTKSAMHLLMKEYVRISALRTSADIGEQLRYTRILETAIYPAVAEILLSARELYPENDRSELLAIVEKGVNYVN